jgi:hypothetical protein
VLNCTIHDGLGMGVSMVNAENIYVKNTQVIGFTQLGFRMDTVKNCTIDQVTVSGIKTRDLTLLDGALDK